MNRTAYPLADWELNECRAELNVTLPGTAVVETSTDSSDGMGGQIQEWVAAGTYSARLSPIDATRSGGEFRAAGRTLERHQVTLTLPYETAITETDRVTYDNVTYSITEVRSRTPWELSRRVLMTELD